MIKRCNADHPIKQASLRSLFAGDAKRHLHNRMVAFNVACKFRQRVCLKENIKTIQV